MLYMLRAQSSQIILCEVNEASKNTKWSLRPETFVPAFPCQSNHPVLCNSAKEPRWYNQPYVSHTLTHTYTVGLYLESTATAGEQEAKLATTGRM